LTVDPAIRGTASGIRGGVQASGDKVRSASTTGGEQQGPGRGLYESATSATSDEGADRTDPSNIKVEDFICGEGEIAADFSSVSA
jgi:hypothetical protein